VHSAVINRNNSLGIKKKKKKKEQHSIPFSFFPIFSFKFFSKLNIKSCQGDEKVAPMFLPPPPPPSAACAIPLSQTVIEVSPFVFLFFPSVILSALLHRRRFRYDGVNETSVDSGFMTATKAIIKYNNTA
jgi:hypothetical protein